MGLIYDTIDEALKAMERLFDFISPQVLTRARDVLIGLHALINFYFVSSATPLLRFLYRLLFLMMLDLLHQLRARVIGLWLIDYMFLQVSLTLFWQAIYGMVELEATLHYGAGFWAVIFGSNFWSWIKLVYFSFGSPLLLLRN